MNILAVDPGTEKCGLAVLSDALKVLDKKIVDPDVLTREIISFASRYAVSKIVIGEGTGSKFIKKELSLVELPVDVVFIPEAFSTLDARKRYYNDNPPKLFFRILPVSLLVPPCPIDDYAAVVLGERYLKFSD
ncbi:hypothetical protein A3J90_08295 [candidate division WOR-1 bacterium RIFOXYC2_FULL_37_10]|uniref:YqgF/RNase H-like domain-containing protein n=1 Tax=candidate division WOR-1 bacterium RIFOXYB2_FULL_37_13 TaxID=1802579 RepID=A0A1F4SZ11_UNCSA|nr:MAG: hypothetical protein A2246_00780 [candidate division WOR-1 bacterium RIFOXYA2_FULL_37_7]OGC25053.1 MAG: hypothetical protein A2310_00080 [candidate division WOR-1 bacterium RIFOXYB2_FULL_37_13]OGC37045.1 MAG: hypothetical protein A3J90_08295 [candidate division WOR-1 bacterium RIFOXYC2_FULL_37_10]